MSIKTILLISAIVLALASLSQGLKCYQCAYGEIEDTPKSEIEKLLKLYNVSMDNSCKTGKSPDDDYLGECNSVPANGNLVMSCMKLVVDEKVLTKSVKLTVRGCFTMFNETRANYTKSCDSVKLSNLTGWIDEVPLIRRTPTQTALKALASNLGYPITNPSGNTCLCDKDECNAAISINPLHIAVVSFFALIVSLVSNQN